MYDHLGLSADKECLPHLVIFISVTQANLNLDKKKNFSFLSFLSPSFLITPLLQFCGAQRLPYPAQNHPHLSPSETVGTEREYGC